jgi:hypothetical protein
MWMDENMAGNVSQTMPMARVTMGRCCDHNFLRFFPILGEKIGVFLKNQCYDQFFPKLSFVLSQKCEFFRQIFRRKYLKNHNIGPRSGEFSHVGLFACLLLAVFLQIAKISQIWASFFTVKVMYILVLTKKYSATFGRFFTNSSGDPVAGLR